jgi:hypothetical protein
MKIITGILIILIGSIIITYIEKLMGVHLDGWQSFIISILYGLMWLMFYTFGVDKI